MCPMCPIAFEPHTHARMCVVHHQTHQTHRTGKEFQRLTLSDEKSRSDKVDRRGPVQIPTRSLICDRWGNGLSISAKFKFFFPSIGGAVQSLADRDLRTGGGLIWRIFFGQRTILRGWAGVWPVRQRMKAKKVFDFNGITETSSIEDVFGRRKGDIFLHDYAEHGLTIARVGSIARMSACQALPTKRRPTPSGRPGPCQALAHSASPPCRALAVRRAEGIAARCQVASFIKSFHPLATRLRRLAANDR